MKSNLNKRGKWLVFFLSFFLLCSFSTAAFSDVSSKLAFKDLFEFDRDNDVSIKLLRSVFGQFNGILRRKTQMKELPTIYNDLFRTFNQIMMALATLLLTYTFLVGILNTASEGKFMGEKQHSIWTPIRSVAGFALIIPTDSGYSMIQVIMMWVVVQGIGAAHQIWATAIDGLTRYKVVQLIALAPDQGQYSTHMQNLLANTYCFYKTQARLLADEKGEKIPAAVDLSQVYYFSRADKREGFSFNCCSRKKGGDFTFICTKNGERPFPASECYSSGGNDPPPTMIQCGIFSRSLVSYSVVDQGTFVQMAQLYLTAGLTAVADQDYTEQNKDGYPIRLLSPNPVLSSTRDISTIVQTKQIEEAKTMAEGKNEIKKRYGWADAGAYFFEFAERNNEIADVGSWDNLGLDVQKCVPEKTGPDMDPKGPCNLGSKLKQSYMVPPVLSDLQKIKPDKGKKEGLTTLSFDRLQDVSLTEMIDTITGLVARLYCGLLFGTFSPQDIYSVDDSGLPFQPAGTDKPLHPLLWIQAIGHRFVITAELILGIGGLLALILSAVSGIFGAISPGAVMFSAVMRLLLSPLFFVCGMIFSMGLTMEVYIPLVPYIIFTFGVIGWLIAVLETILAAPLVALGITYPEGHEMMARSDPAVMLLTNIFIRPTFMIFGLVSGLFISQVAINFLNHSFSAATAASTVSSGMGGFEILLIISIYMSFVIAILNKSFGLITQIPDQVLRWISNTSNFGEYSHGEEQVKQAAEGAAGRSGEMYRSSAGKSQQSMKESEQKGKGQKEQSDQAYDQNMAGEKGADGSAVAPKSKTGKNQAQGEAAAEKDKTRIDQQKSAASSSSVSAKGKGGGDAGDSP